MADNFFSYFFGIDGTDYNGRYINQFSRSFNGALSMIGTKHPVWIDTHKAFQHYVEIPELRTVINRRASMMASGVPVLYKDGAPFEGTHWINDLIKKPNPVQSWGDLIFALAVNDGLYSVAFAYAPRRSFGIVNLMVPLPANKIKVIPTGKKFKQMDVDGWIEKIVFHYDDNTTEDYKIEELIYLMTPDGINLISPSSRIESLKMPLSNIKAQYKKRNVLLENIGSIGILSATGGDNAGAIPMTPEEKREIRDDWYRRSVDELIITEADVKWTPMSYPTRDLMLFEELNEDKLTLIDTYGMSVYLFSSTTGATFANVKEGIKMTYTDTIIPETEKMYSVLSDQLGLSAEGYELRVDFSHIPALQIDDKAKAESNKAESDYLGSLVDRGLISPEQMASELGYEYQDTKPSPEEAQRIALQNAQTELRGTVGGLQGIISLNASVSRGEMDRNTAVATLVSYYGYDQTTAEALVTTPEAPPAGPPAV